MGPAASLQRPLLAKHRPSDQNFAGPVAQGGFEASRKDMALYCVRKQFCSIPRCTVQALIGYNIDVNMMIE